MSQSLFISVGDGCRLAYRFDGPIDKPVLLLSNSIATTFRMWDLQIEDLTKHFRVLRYDSRGHGLSDVPTGDYSIERLGRDVIDLLDGLKIPQIDFCGLSLGGIVGQWLGVNAPDRINHLVLCNTSAYLGPADQWVERIALVQRVPIAETAAMFLGNWLPERMVRENGSLVQKVRSMVLSINPRGLAGSYAAVRDVDMRRLDTLIKCPTLVIAGQFDTVTLAIHSELIAKAIPAAKLVVLPAVHLSNIEWPTEFINAMLGFLLRSPGQE